jgi:hypothetical protein
LALHLPGRRLDYYVDDLRAYSSGNDSQDHDHDNYDDSRSHDGTDGYEHHEPRAVSAPELEALLALQDLDTHIDQERHRRAHLPERTELSELEHAEGLKRAERSELAAVLGEVDSRQAAAERELKATEDRARQVNARLYGGTVSASRELQAMANDVEGLRGRASELEDRVLALMEEREPLGTQMASLEEALADLAAREREVRQRLSTAEAELDVALTRLEGQRLGVASAVPQRLLGTYERLRARLGGVAVARLASGRCGGCHLSLPAVELDRIRHQAPGSLEYCEQCGRVLVVAGA